MRLSALLPVALAAVLAGVAGYGAGLVSAPRDEAPTEAAPQARSDPAGDPDPVTGDDPGAAEPRDGRRPRRPRAVSLSEVLPAIDVPGLAAGDGAITGSVRTPDGEAVEDVTVVLTPSIPQRLLPDGRPEHEIPPEELIEAYARRLLFSRNNRRETSTDAEGAFTADGLSDGSSYAVAAWKDGFNVVPSDPAAAARATLGQVIEFTARPTSRLELALRLPDGNAPERASVFARLGGRTERFTWSPTRSFVDLEPGSYDVFAVAGADEEFKSKSVALEVTAEGADAPHEILLTGRPGIRGTVQFDEPEGAAQVFLWAARIDADTEMDATQLVSVGTRTAAAATRGYDFRFQDLSPGKYAVGVGRSSRGPVEKFDTVTVGDGPTEHAITLPKLDPSRYIKVVGTDADGATVDIRSVQLSYRGQKRNRSLNAAVMKMPDGSVRVLHQVVPSNVRDARLYLTATSPTHGTSQVEYRQDTITEVHVPFAAPASLTVSVEGHAETRYADSVRVTLYRVQQEGNATRTQGAGAFTFKGTSEHTFGALQPGSYYVYLAVGARRAVVVEQQNLEVGTGTNALSLQVPQLSRLTVLGAQRSVRATRTSPGYRVRVNGVPGDARFVIDLLPPGTYEIRDGRGRRQTIAVPGTSEVQF